ncbi:MAG: hypothetical protein K2X50_08355 [Gammaproteobacteria bacterium]|nr:hypothetical protein [Gammaproteobacteria bacterium]
MKKKFLSPRRNTASGKPGKETSSGAVSSTSPRSTKATTPRKGLFSGLSPRKNTPPEENPAAQLIEPKKALNLLDRVYTARGLLHERMKSLQGKPAICIKARAEILAALYDLKELGLNTQAMRDLESLLPTIVPIGDLFTEAMLHQLATEPTINQSHPLLKSLNELIYLLQNLLGEFTFEDQGEKKNLQRIYNPLKELCNYYNESREQIINAQSPEERLALIATQEAYIFGDSFYVCEVNKGSFSTSGEKALVIISRNFKGIIVRVTDYGLRAVYFVDGLVLKANPIGKNFNEPEAEKSVGSWYQLHCPIPHLDDKPVLVAAPSESIKILHAPLDQQEALNPALDPLITEYLLQKKQERMVQVGYQFDGSDFHMVLQAESTLYSWKIYIDQAELIAHLTTLEEIYNQDKVLLLDFKKWPAPLLLYSGAFSEAFIKLFLQSELVQNALTNKPALFSDILPKESEVLEKLLAGNKQAWYKLLSENEKALHLLIKAFPDTFHNFILGRQDLFQNSLAAGLSRFPAIFHELLQNYTPERAYHELQNIFLQICQAFYSRFCIANMPIDPSDLTAVNLRFITRINAKKEPVRFICTFDADNALEYPVTRLVNEKDGSAVHYPTTKCLLYLLPGFTEPIDKEFREEFLSHTPLNYVLDWCHLLYEFDQQKRMNIKKQLITKKDVIEKTDINNLKEDNVTAVLLNRKRILHNPDTSLRIPQTLTPDRLPGMLDSYENLEEAMIADLSLTHLQGLRIIRPAVAAYYERACFPKLKNENPFLGILNAINVIGSKQAPSFEHAFLGEKITALVIEKMGDKFKQEYMDPLTQYNTLLEKQNSAETPDENPLPSMETLRKECKIPELNNISLHELLEKHHHISGEHINNASLTIKEAIKLFIQHIDFNKKYYETGKIDMLLHYLNRIGLEFPFVKLKCFTAEQCERLLSLAAESALPGVIKLLIKNDVKLNKLNAVGEATLHTLLRSHRNKTTQNVIDTLTACLAFKANPEQPDKENRTPLMHFIDNTDPNNSDFCFDVLKVMKEHRTNLNQSTAFQKKQTSEHTGRLKHLVGTPLDYAIDCNNPAAVLALVKNGATDFVDMEAALQFAESYKNHDTFKECVELLKNHPRFAVTYAINEFSTSHPDEDHPAHCVMQGAKHDKRYFLLSVWSQIFEENGEIKRINSLRSGAHIVIPLSKQSYEFCLWSSLADKDPNNAKPNQIYLSKEGEYCVLDPDGNLKLGSLKGNIPFNLDQLYQYLKAKKLSHEHLVEKKQMEYKTLFMLAARKEVHPFLLHVKFFPEFPLVQRIVELINERLGCPGTHSELWRSNTLDGKKTFPLLVVNTVIGESFKQFEANSDKIKDLLQCLDRRIFSLQAVIAILTSQEDGHADQYKVPEQQSGKYLVNIDPDRAIVPRLYWDGKEKKILNKDIFYLTEAFEKIPLDPDAIMTIICANGKRLPDVALNEVDAEILIRENAGLFFDEIFHEAMTEEQFLLKLFPRDALCKGVTFTTAEMIERDKKDPLPSSLRKAIEQLDNTESRQSEKTKVQKKKRSTVFGIIKDQAEQFTLIDCPLELRTFAELYELYVKIAKFLYLKSRSEIYPTSLFREACPELFHQYNSKTKQNPNLTTCQKYLLINDGNQRTLTTQKDVVDCTSQNLSTKFRGGQFCNSIESLIEFYHQSKKTATEVVAVIHKIDISNIPSSDTFRSQKQFENFIRCIQWSDNKKSNRLMLNALHEIQKKCKFQLTELCLNLCDDLTWDDLVKFLQNSPKLQRLELTNCNGLKNALGNSVFTLLEDYSPEIKKVVIINTDITHFTYDSKKLASLIHLEVRECKHYKTCQLVDPQLHHLDVSDNEKLETISYTYTKENSLPCSIEDERPLNVFLFQNCKSLRPESIEAVLDASPFLQKINHENTQPYNPRAFISFALMQNRFCQNTFDAMVQNGTLILHNLIEDHDLRQILLWLKHPNNKVTITEVNFLSATQLSQIAKFQFIFELNPKPRILEPGPKREKRTQGNAYEWDIGLATVSAMEELPNGNIFAIGQRKVTTARGQPSTVFGIRTPERTNAREFETFGTLSDRRKDEFTGKLISLDMRSDVISSTMMPDGTILLSDRSNKCILLDTISQNFIALNILQVKSFCGDVLALSHNVFALHSDQIYIIIKRHDQWIIKHKITGTPILHPIIKGPNNLVAFCSREQSGSTLSIMNYQSGVTIYTQHFNTQLIKPLRFLNKKEILICNGEATHKKVVGLGPFQKTITQNALTIINIETCEITILNRDFLINADNIHNICAVQATSEEILITTLGTQNKRTLIPTHRYLCDANVTRQPVMCYQNDVLTLKKNESQNTCLEMQRNKFHILDLKLPHENQDKFDIIILTEGEIIIKITTPEPIERSTLDIDLSSNRAWYETICANQPTGRTLFDLLSAFFEKTSIQDQTERNTQTVTCHDNVILIKGLTEKEANTLRRTLKSFWQHPLSPTASPRLYRPRSPNLTRSQDDSSKDAVPISKSNDIFKIE